MDNVKLKNKLPFRTGDSVVVLCGKDKKKRGKIIAVDTSRMRVVVEGVNLCTKRIKPNAQNPQGRIEQIEASIHVSNVMLWDESKGKGSRIGRRLSETGKMVRYFKSSNQEVK